MESVLVKKENNFLSDIKNVLFEQSQLLGKEYYPKFNEYHSILKNYEDLPMSLIFLGDTSSGKTTLINATVAYLMLEDQKEIKTKDELAQIRQSYENFKILKPAITENTFSTTIIEPSNDEYYYLKVGENDEEIVDLDKIKKYFTELDKDANEIFSYMKKPKSTDSEDVTPQMIEKEKVLDEKINRRTVLQIPNIKRKIKIYDIPGISGKRPRELAEKILADGCIIPIICYIKDLTSYQANNEGILEIMKIFREKFNDQAYLSIIFTKSDLFYRERLKGSKYFTESNPEEIEGELVDNTPELSANFKAFESTMVSDDFIIMDYQLINPISILISKNSFLTNKTLKDLQNLNIYKLSKWINSIESFFVKCAQHLLEKRIINQIKAAINRDFGQPSKLTADDINEIKIKKESIVNKFSAQIREYVRKFPKNSENLKDNYCDIYTAFMTSIKENESTLDYYYVKSNYIKRQIQLIQPLFNKPVGKDISIMMKTLIVELWKSFSSELTAKLELLVFSNELPNLGRNSLITILLTMALTQTTGTVFRYAGSLAAEALIPGIGAILAGIALIYLTADYIGLWTYSGAREDIINNLLQAFTAYSAKIIDEYDKYFNEMVTAITDSLIQMREKSMIDEMLTQAIEKIPRRKDTFKSMQISTTLIDKIKDDKSLKRGVIEFFSDLFPK